MVYFVRFYIINPTNFLTNFINFYHMRFDLAWSSSVAYSSVYLIIIIIIIICLYSQSWALSFPFLGFRNSNLFKGLDC
jgi:hypothetical protein